jgi:acyl-CoA dehydrogenase family member 9
MVTMKREHQEQLERAKDLIESGGDELGFVRSLFFGRLLRDKILPFPRQDPAEAHRTDELIRELDRFLDEHVDPDRIDAEQQIPRHVIEGLGRLGVMGMTVPREYGGGGFSHTAYCRVLERVSRHCSSTAVLIGAHQSIGLKALVLMGTEQQKRQYLPALASGQMLAAFCLSEPEVGSDAANVQTTARLSEDGQHWIINGEKRYATNAAIAGMMTVMAQTPGETGGKRPRITAFIVTPDMPGFEVISPNRSKCGVRGTWQATLKFTDMRVPVENVLGEVGRGLKVALSVLGYGRCTLSAGCVGGAKEALELAVQHARRRRQFGKAIGEFHLVKQKIARMAEYTFAMDAITYMAAGLVDRHDEDIMLETAISKLFCSEALWQVADDAVQIWAGEGYMREHGLERMLRDARINRIVEGTTEVMTAFIALMGMKPVGEHMQQVLRAARRPIGQFGRLTDFARHEWRDILLGHALDGLHADLAAEGKQLAQLTRSFARGVEWTLRKHRENIVDRQLPQQRIALAVVELYAMAAVISKLQAMLDAHGGDGSIMLRRDLMVGRQYCRSATRRIRGHLRALRDNIDPETIAVADEVLGFAPSVDD